MTDYKGKNKTKSTRIIAAQRAIYKLNAFKEGGNEKPKSGKNFNFAERTQYGRVDTNFNTVFPIRSQLKRLSNPDKKVNMYSTVNFVADAFERFVAKMEQAVIFGNCPKDHPYLSKIKVYRAHQDPYGLYSEYIEDLLDTFVDQINEKTILSFDDWTNQFIYFCKRNGAKFPITFSGFQRTDKSNIFTSVLAISISDIKADDDTKKQEFFLDYPALDFYVNAAKQYGFYVDSDMPWVLVADLNSPAMSLYTKKYDLSTVDQIFSENYSLCYEQDI